MNKYIESDLYRLKGETSFKTALREYLKNATFRWQVAYRLVRSDGISKLIGRVLWKINRSKRTIQISRECDIGYGLYIGHGGPVVVNPSAHIGHCQVLVGKFPSYSYGNFSNPILNRFRGSFSLEAENY